MVFVLLITLFLIHISDVKSSACPNDCNGNGICTEAGRQCVCFDGFQAADCSERICPYGKAWVDLAKGVDNAHNLAECSNMGICERIFGTCTCRTGYEGAACERKSCPIFCSGRGKCRSMRYYAQTKDPGLGVVYNYDTIWDADKIFGCDCNSNFYGPDCSLRVCPLGDDPMTGNGANTQTNPIQFDEIQKVSCKAAKGSFTLTFRGKTTLPIPFNTKITELTNFIESLPTIGAGNTKIVMYTTQVCLETGTSFSVQFTQNFGPLPLMLADGSQLGFSDGTTVPILTVERTTEGTKENAQCSNRGVCSSATGVCTCATNFDSSNGLNQEGTRGDCGYATATIQFCPGVVSCSGHGECLGSPTFKCQCTDGWTGGDCSERICPKSVSWFTLPSAENYAHIVERVECSDMGTCDRVSGICICQSGFSGSACESLTCPGEVAKCNGNGQCLDMNTLATKATINGDLAGYTYGNTPNNAITWDGFKIFGCFCDQGYTGYDCSLKTCPFGDDPGTVQQFDESQIISCTDSDGTGTIVLTFREKSALPIQALSTTAEVKAALESIAGVGVVAVETFADGAVDMLCPAVGNQFLVTFLTTHGNLPNIKAVGNNVDSVVVAEHIPGNKEMLECSGRGLCDRITGLCTCFEGYGSSDGMGKKGLVGDCGFLLPSITIT